MERPCSTAARDRRDALVQSATDADAMQEVFLRLIQPPGQRRYEIAACRVGALRRGTRYRFAVDYHLRLIDQVDGQTRKQLLTGVSYGLGRTRRTWESLPTEDFHHDAGQDHAPFPPFAYVPDMDMLVLAFPHDPGLPALAELLAGPPAELVPPLLAQFGAAAWRIDEWVADPIRYRVESRATLRLGLRVRHAASGRTDGKRFYAKVYREEAKARQAHHLQVQLHDRLGANAAPFRVATPVAHVACLRALVQGELSGEPLFHLLQRGQDAIPPIRMAARATASLHGLDLDLDRATASARPRSLRTRIDRLRSIEERMRLARPELAGVVGEVVAAITEGLADVPEKPTHGDLKPDHFLVDGATIAMLDFDLLSASDPVLDVANMELRLARAQNKATSWHATSRTAAQIFVEEYLAHAPDGADARLPLHRAMESIVEAARTRRPDGATWHERVERSIREAHRALSAPKHGVNRERADTKAVHPDR